MSLYGIPQSWLLLGNCSVKLGKAVRTHMILLREETPSGSFFPRTGPDAQGKGPRHDQPPRRGISSPRTPAGEDARRDRAARARSEAKAPANEAVAKLGAGRFGRPKRHSRESGNLVRARIFSTPRLL